MTRNVAMEIHHFNECLEAAVAYGSLLAGENNPEKIRYYHDNWDKKFKPALMATTQAGLVLEILKNYMKALRDAYGTLDIKG